MNMVLFDNNFIFNKIDDYKELVNIREKYQKLLQNVSFCDIIRT